jgi:hypothetical protein
MSRLSHASALRLGNGDKAIYGRAVQYLNHPGWPLNHDAIDPLVVTETEMEAAIVLTREA